MKRLRTEILAGEPGADKSSLLEPTHLIHLALAGDLVVVPNLIHSYDLAQDCGELVEEGLGHVVKVAAGTKQRGKRKKQIVIHAVEAVFFSVNKTIDARYASPARRATFAAGNDGSNCIDNG